MVTKDSMVTLGVDLASQPKKTGVCLIRWDDELAHVMKLSLEKDLEDGHGLSQLFGPEYRVDGLKIDKIGIDAPFGWPVCFAGAVRDYSLDTKTWPPENRSDLFPTTRFPHLRYRRTDEIVKKKGKGRVTPLSVSSNWIAATAMRAASLLAERASSGEAIDRSGRSGRFVEVYPAAALSAWELPTGSYKGRHRKGEAKGPRGEADRGDQALAQVLRRVPVG